MSEVTLEFLGRRVERMGEDIARVHTVLAHIETLINDIRGGMNVQLAMLQRQHNTLENAVAELQSIHQFNARMHERIRKLEDVP